MIYIQSFVFNPFMENTYLLYDETKECIIIDPGCYEKEEQGVLIDFVKKKGLKVVQLINTHCHIDHVLGNQFVKEEFGVELSTSAIEEQVLKAVKTYSSNYGFPLYQEATVDSYLEEGQQVRFGDTVLDILFVPGHSPGHLVFYHTEEKICIGGDVLFQRSVGRTDLPGGDHETLMQSIRQKMYSLPDDMTVYPGHGPTTTIGEEKQFNPFCAVL